MVCKHAFHCRVGGGRVGCKPRLGGSLRAGLCIITLCPWSRWCGMPPNGGGRCWRGGFLDLIDFHSE